MDQTMDQGNTPDVPRWTSDEPERWARRITAPIRWAVLALLWATWTWQRAIFVAPVCAVLVAAIWVWR